jgi:ligand-binding sensor domain-containing protein
MKKEKTTFHGIKLFTGIALCFIMTSCNGQANNSDKQIIIKEKEIIQFPNLKNQISQVVRNIFQDSKGTIWFGAENGAWRLSNHSLIHIDSIKSESGKGVTIKDIAEGQDGKIWFGHTNGLSSIDGEKVENYYESDGLINNDVWSVATDVMGNVWIGTIEGACKFNRHGFTNFDLPEGKMDSTLGISSTKMVHNIMVDSKGVIWFSTNAGLFSYADNKISNVSDKVGIQTNFVNEIFEDRSGVFWISTKKGLYYLTENKAINITEDKIETGKGIGCIAKDENGIIWFVSNQHYLYTYDGKDLVKFEKSEENKGPVVFQIYKDQQSRLWFVGYGGAYRLENGRFINITQNGPW